MTNRSAVIMAILTVLLLASFIGLYINWSSPRQAMVNHPAQTPIPFDYNLGISPTNASIMQGNSEQFKVAISYMQGSPENVTLSVSGGPDAMFCTFSQKEGFPTNSSMFNSTLTVYTSEAVPSNSYNLTISSTTDYGRKYSLPFILSVINSQVTVSGSITSGVGKVLTEIIFEQLSSSGSTLQTFTAPVNSGQYSIILPNNQFYAVSDAWTSSDGSSGTHHFIFPFGVSAGVGVTSITCPFSGG